MDTGATGVIGLQAASAAGAINLIYIYIYIYIYTKERNYIYIYTRCLYKKTLYYVFVLHVITNNYRFSEASGATNAQGGKAT